MYRTKIKLGLIVYGLFFLLYFLNQHFPLFAPRPVPYLFIDHAIPFNPHWVWVYILTYLYSPLTLLILSEEKRVRGFFWTHLFLILISSIIYFLYPTLLSRDPYPIIGQGLSEFALELTRSIDRPLNCLPSLHVGFSTIATFWIYNEKKLWGLWGALYTLLMIYSIIATRQHVFLDAVTSLALSGLIIFFYQKKSKN